jgi:hypothetical protein
MCTIPVTFCQQWRILLSEVRKTHISFSNIKFQSKTKRKERKKKEGEGSNFFGEFGKSFVKF